MTRPYVYQRADDLGIPIVDSKERRFLAVTSVDVILAKKANSKLCALSRAAMRLPGVAAAYFFRTNAFLEYKDRMVRFQLPASVQKEIVSFDRSQIFAAGVYQISPISPSSQRRAKQKAASSRRIRAEGVRPENAKFGKRTQPRSERKIAVKETASLAAAIERIEASEPKIDTPEAKQFHALMGRRTHGAVSKKAATPLLSSRNFTRRAQYVRDMHEPDDDQ